MARRNQSGKGRPPAEGERAAIVGYAEQYRAAAILVLRGLQERSLEWIRLADPKAGRVDDFQLSKAGQVDAYQFKWSLHRGKFSLSDLLVDEPNSTSLIRQLVDGWQKLRKLHSPKRVVVHLVSNNLASDSDTRPGTASSGRRLHFSSFISEVWTAVRGGSRLIPPDWNGVWEEVRRASRLSNAEFFDFVECCSLDFGWTDPAQDPRPSLQHLNDFEDDLRTIRERIIDSVASPQRTIEMSERELLVHLGWEGRIGLRNIHSFPDPPLGYCEVAETNRALHNLIESTNSGYLALVGTPGSGKSTLVSKSFTNLRHRIVRYYAFVLDVPTTGALRGESVVFLHDLVTLLSDFGFRGPPGLVKSDRLQLLDRMRCQLQEAHTDWRTTGRKTIIVIDGLDHIPREQSPARSLLKDLPLPADIPEGVLFLLGAQTTDLEDLLPAVRHQLQQTARVLNIQPISRAGLLSWLDSTLTSVPLSNEQKEAVFTLTGGHPLAVNLLLHRLKSVSDPKHVCEVFETAPSYPGSMDEFYFAMWSRHVLEAADRDDIRRILALVARLRNGFDKPLLTALANSNQNVLEQFVTRWLPLFRLDGERWLPFHNSVRLFLIRETSKDAFRLHSETKDRDWHLQLARYLRSLALDNPWSWELAFHLNLANQHGDVLTVVNSERIRHQLSHFRPIPDLRDDVMIGLRSARVLHDVSGVVRLIFLMLELSSREDALADANCDIPSRLMELALYDPGLLGAARSQVRNGYELRIGMMSGFRAAEMMLRLGVDDEARRLFQLVEPWHLIKSADTDADEFDHADYTLLETWVTTAIKFRPIGDVEAIVDQLKYSPFLNQDDAAGGHSRPSYEQVRVRLLYCIGLAANELSDRTIVELIIERLHADGAEEFLIALLHEVAITNLDKDRPFAVTCSAEAIKVANRNFHIGDSSRILAAEVALRVLADKPSARRLLVNVTQPEARNELEGVSFSDLIPRFRFNRLLYALGDRLDLKDAVPDAEDSQLLVRLERAVTRLGQLWAAAWAAEPMSPGLFLTEVKPLFKVFETARQTLHTDRNQAHRIVACQSQFTDMAIECARQFGVSYVSGLAEHLASKWTFEEPIWPWPPTIVIEALRSLRRNGMKCDFCDKWLDDMVSRLLNCDEDATSRISSREVIFEALIDFGRVDQAKCILRESIKLSAGIRYRKDFQMNEWIRWGGEANRVDELGAEARVSFLLPRVLDLPASTEEPAAYEAGEALLALVWSVSPRWAVAQLEVLADGGVVGWADGLAKLIALAIEGAGVEPQLAGALIANILMPLSDSAHGNLCQRTLDKVLERESLTRLCSKLWGAANTFTPATSRKEWLYSLKAAFEKHRVSVADVPAFAEDTLDYRRVRANSFFETKAREELSEADFFSRARDVCSFIEVFQTASSTSNFPWSTRFVSWVADITDEETWRLFQELSRLGADVQLQVACLEKLSKCECTRAVFDSAEVLLKGLDATDWDRSWSGGTKSRVATMMAKCDSTRAFAVLFDELVDDLLSNLDIWYGVGLQLGEILRCFSDAPPADQVWTYIEDYLSACFAHVDVASAVDVPIVTGTSNNAMLDVLDFALDHPVQILSQGARRAICELIDSHSSLLEGRIQQWLAVADEKSRACLSVLSAVFERVSLPRTYASESICRLAKSRDIDIRLLCDEIGELTRTHTLSSPSVDETVLANYQSRPLIDARPKLHGFPQHDSPSPNDSSFDPRELTRPFSGVVAELANAARLDKDIVLQRVYDLMRQLGSERRWNGEAERRLRGKCERMHLNYAFTRPRFSLVRRAILHATGELTDAGRLSGENAQLFAILRSSDPGMEHVRPSPRPPYVTEWYAASSTGDQDTWLRINPESARTRFATAGCGWVIVAESHEWHSGAFSESLRSVIHRAGLERIRQEAPDRLFPRKVKERVRNYTVLQSLDRYELTIENLAFDFDSPGGNWLAFNPVLARSLGWKPSTDDLFGWAFNGRTCVRSVWWMDGHPHYRARFADECPVGSGWVVLLSLEAIKYVQDELGGLQQLFVLERTWQRGDSDPRSSRVCWSTGKLLAEC